MPDTHEYLRAETADWPVDNDLPGLPELLDPRRFGEILRSCLVPPPGDITDQLISYIRYKPGTNCLIAYRLTFANPDGAPDELVLYAKVYTYRDYANALAKADNARWMPVGATPPVIPLPDLHAILYCYPNDCLIDGLKSLCSHKKIQRWLYEYDPHFPAADWRISDTRMKVTLVRYKPERRAVLRCDTKAVHRRTSEKKPLSVYIRAYAGRQSLDIYSIQQKLYHRAGSDVTFSVPMPILYLPERNLFFMEAARGQDLLGLLAGDETNLDPVAAAIAGLHREENSDLPAHTVDALLTDALATSGVIRHISPEYGKQAIRIVAGLTSNARRLESAKLGFVHGDFYYGQVLLCGSTVVLLDFDRSYFGDPTADIGNFCAHLRYQGWEGNLSDCSRMERRFLDAYQDRAGRKLDECSWKFHLALGLFQLAVGPFRRLEPDWRKKTGRILDECQRVLQE